jgi:hypothetical protein
VNERIKKIIQAHWEEMVHSTYFYRGMSLKHLDVALSFALDPNKNPLENIIPMFMEYSQLLFMVIDAGLEFNVNDFYVEPLHKVLTWTVRDIQNPGIDFTTNYADAAAYAFNYAGSQIKHNFNLIINSIHKHKNEDCFKKVDQQKFWDLTEKIRKHLANKNDTAHKPIVVKVRRSCAAFQNEKAAEFNVGPYDFFYNRVVREAIEKNVLSVDRIAFFLHQKSQADNFNIRLTKPLSNDDIEEVIYL